MLSLFFSSSSSLWMIYGLLFMFLLLCFFSSHTKQRKCDHESTQQIQRATEERFPIFMTPNNGTENREMFHFTACFVIQQDTNDSIESKRLEFTFE